MTLTQQDLDNIADAVWDEDLTNHNTIKTSGAVQQSIEYNGFVAIDTINGVVGTAWNIGTHGNPVNNLADALTIATARDIDKLDITGSLTITTGQDISGYTLIADRSLGNSVTVNSGAITAGTYFENLTVSGTMNGSVRYTTSVMGAINNFDGGAKNCLLVGDITITGTGSNYFTDCDVYVTDSSTYRSINLNGYTLNIIRCRGNYEISNKTSINTTSIDLVGGRIHIDNTCTAGTVEINGIAEVVDDSTAGCTVEINSMSHTAISESVWDAPLTEHTIEDTVGASQLTTEYDNKVIIDTVSGFAGTTYPIGTNRKPSNNLTDALIITSDRNINRIFLHTDITVEASHNISNMAVETVGVMGTNVTLAVGCAANNTVFRYLNLGGIVNNSDTLLIENCSVFNLENFTGIMQHVTFAQGSEISIGSWAELYNCRAGGEPTNEPEISIGTSSLNIQQYRGNIKLTNKTGDNRTVVGCLPANITIASTCVAGKIQILGIGDVEADNSGAGCQVDVDAAITNEYIADTVWNENMSEHEASGTFGLIISDLIKLTGYKVTKSGDVITIYESDESTPWRQYDLTDGGRVEL